MPTETHTPGFANPPLERAVALGAVDATSARLWFRAQGPIRVRWWADGESPRVMTHAPPPDAATRDHTFSFALPTDFDPSTPLQADTPYRYQVEDAASAELIAEGGFRTAPRTAGDGLLSFGLFSCNQPFEADGSVRAESAAMLRAAQTVLRDHDARFALSIGDQMYTDAPADRNLFDPAYFERVAPLARERLRDCSTQEVRRLLHARYRHFFALPDWRALHHSLPIYPILDDHMFAIAPAVSLAN